MARTWPVTRRKVALFRAIDMIGRPFAAHGATRDGDAPRPVRKILVLELWHMGDVVLATAALQGLRALYPDATITLLAKAHAEELLHGTGLADEIVTFDFPWTATTSKYDLSRYDKPAIGRLVRELRAQHFDLSVDCRMDLRSNVLTRSIGARRRVGYDWGGGAFLLTDRLPAPPADQHKVEDWLSLLRELEPSSPGNLPPSLEPRLDVTESETAAAVELLKSYEVDQSETIVGIHPGGSHHAKRWPEESFAEVARALKARYRVRLLVFVDPEGQGSDMQLDDDAIFVRTSIREMMALFKHCALLLCNDSGPMHIAAALGTPLVAVFRTGDPNAYGPQGLRSTVVGRGAPWGQTSEIAVDEVLSAAESVLIAASPSVSRNAESVG